MPISIADLQGLAQQLAEKDCDEARLRASVSRSYYAAFHALLPLVERLPASQEEQPGATKITHHELQCRLDEWTSAKSPSAVPTSDVLRLQIARTMRAARQIRVVADYRLDDEVSLSIAETQYQRARRLIRGVEEALGSVAAISVASGAVE